jgi:hypothetical protein
VSCAAITLCVASQRVFIVVIYFVTDSVRKLSDTPSYICDLNLQYLVLGNSKIHKAECSSYLLYITLFLTRCAFPAFLCYETKLPPMKYGHRKN